MSQRPNMIGRPGGKESYKFIKNIQSLVLSHPHDMLISHGTRPSNENLAKKIKYRRRNMASAFIVGSVQSILRFKWPSPWKSSLSKIHTKKTRRKSSSESLQLWPRAWEAVKPETKLWSVPATRTRRRQRSTYQSSLCHHGRPTIRVPYTLGFPPKHGRTAGY